MGAPVSILQYFEVNNPIHLEQYRYLITRGTGKFNNNFITREMNISYPTNWFLTLTQMLGQAYLDATMQTADLSTLQVALKYARKWLEFKNITPTGF